ncbi:MAG: pitrilysin family protein [Endomicrobiia bacterium]|nr:pitrilysin family protein [Endomicrobiia bacterium]
MKKKTVVSDNKKTADGAAGVKTAIKNTAAAIIIVIMMMIITGAAPMTALSAPRAQFLERTQNLTLANGMKALLCPETGTGVTSVQVWVSAGSIYENEKTAGLSHFLEHLIFKGTRKFPGDEISRLVETSGGAINAGTSKEYTVYYIDAPSEAAGLAVEILSDAMSDAAFPADEIEKERPVVLEEIKRHDDEPTSVLYELLSETLFTTSPYRKRIIGDEKVIETVSRDEIIAYYKRYYTPSNMTVSIAGDFDAATMRPLVEKYFGGQQAGALRRSAPNLKETAAPSEKLRRAAKNVAHTYAACAYLAPDTSSDRQFAADVAAHILGGAESSRLYRKLREEKRIVYGVGAGFYAQKGDGIFEVSAVFDKENFSKVRQAVAEEISALAAEGPSPQELERAREVIKTGWLFGTETAHDRASMMGYWSVAENLAILDRYIAAIEAVSAQDVKEFFARYILASDPVWAAVEPEPKKPETGGK